MAKNIEINIKTSEGVYETLYPSVNPDILKLNSGNVNVDNSISESLGLGAGSTINDVLGKMTSGVYLENQPYINYDLFSNNTNIGDYKQVIDGVAYQCKITTLDSGDDTFYYAQIFSKDLKTEETHQTEKYQINLYSYLYNYYNILNFVKAEEKIYCFCSKDFYFCTSNKGISWEKIFPSINTTATTGLDLIPYENTDIVYKNNIILFINDFGRFVSIFINENKCNISESSHFSSNVIIYNNYAWCVSISGSSSYTYYNLLKILLSDIGTSVSFTQVNSFVGNSRRYASFLNVANNIMFLTNQSISKYSIDKGITWNSWSVKTTCRNIYFINNSYYFWGYANPASPNEKVNANMSIYDSSFNLLSTLKANTDFIYVEYNELNKIFYYFTYQNHNLLQTNPIFLYQQYLVDVLSKQLTIPASQIVGGTGIKFEQGTYTGTGGKTVTLTFVNEPDYIFVYYYKTNSSNSSYSKVSAFLKKGIDKEIDVFYFESNISKITSTWNNTTVSLYNSNGGDIALNGNNYTYYYIGIYNVN